MNTKAIQKTYNEFSKNLLHFKTIMNKLLEEKVFHYAVLNSSVNELVNLQKITVSHQKILTEMVKDPSSSYALFDHEKVGSLNLSSAMLSYKAFLELMKNVHEAKEEEINNIIRELLENDYDYNSKDNTFGKKLIKIRDEWREAMSPEVLDANEKPIHSLSVLDQVNLEVNKVLFDNLI